MGIPVLNYPDYEIFSNGTIFSHKSNKFLKPNINKSGYYSVELFNEKGSKRCLIHRLVAQAFLDNPLNLPQVNHKDENPHNNCVDNLEWCTAKYNMNYGIGAKTRHKKIDYSTEQRKEIARKNGSLASKIVAQLDKFSNIILRIYPSGKNAHKCTNINHSHIIECCKGKRKTAGGYKWIYCREEE